jgi:hypothetical protein
MIVPPVVLTMGARLPWTNEQRSSQKHAIVSVNLTLSLFHYQHNQESINPAEQAATMAHTNVSMYNNCLFTVIVSYNASFNK